MNDNSDAQKGKLGFTNGSKSLTLDLIVLLFVFDPVVGI